jgi:hypothetical protein
MAVRKIYEIKACILVRAAHDYPIMNVTKLADKLESLNCRKDDKARRVLNTAPDTVANITAEALENGVTIEALESLNVPVYRYNSQVTIHGNIPDFDSNARPGGYKAVFKNGNGSVGVKYIAIDAAKKDLIARAARLSESGWHASKDSQGFELSRYFIIQDGNQERAKQDALACLRSIPVNRFFGSACAGVLAYGRGYYVSAYIGAIAQVDVWPLIGEMLKVNEAEFTAKEDAAKREQDAKNAAWQAECEEKAARREQARAALLTGLPSPLTVEPKEPGNRFRLLSDYSNELVTIELTKERGRMYYAIIERNGKEVTMPERKLYKTGWPKALASRRLFPV